MIEIKIPKLGLTMESAKLVRWEFRSGDEVKKGETVVVIETDKVTFEVPAPARGIVHPIAEEGSTCAVEETVGYLARDRQEYQRIVKEYPSAVKVETAEKVEAMGRKESSLGRGRPIPSVPARGQIKASPLARSMAQAHNLDLTAIVGSGPGGRIVRADILRVLGGEAISQEERAVKAISEDDKAFPGKETSEDIPIEGVRRVIFDNMYQSISQSAQLTLHTEASAEGLIALRERLRRGERKISYNAILIKVSAIALRSHPKINASVAGNMIRVWKQVHIGLAMEANQVLVVPVVRSPDIKTIGEIDREVAGLIHKIKENRLSPDDLADGTFTITSLGFADIDYFTPIIRPPESAILGVGRIVKKPIIKNDQVIPEARIGLSLTFDHRIIDGAPAARFLKTIKETVEDPLLMLS